MSNEELIKQLRDLSKRQKLKGYLVNAELIDQAISKINWYRSVAEVLEKG